MLPTKMPLSVIFHRESDDSHWVATYRQAYGGALKLIEIRHLRPNGTTVAVFR